MRRLIFLLGVVLVAISIQAQDQVTWEVLRLINEVRRDSGISPLVLNDSLMQAAQRHSDDMAQGEFLSHTGSDGSEFWERIATTGYNMTSGAENVLYRNDLDPAATFAQWQGSASHYNNMLNPLYQEMGLAYAQSNSGRYYFTLVLAARADFEPPTATPASPSTQAPLRSTDAPVIATDTPMLPTSTPTLAPVTATPVPPSVTPTASITSPPTQIAAMPTISDQLDASVIRQGVLGALMGQVRITQIQPTPPPSPSAPPPTATPVPSFDLSLRYSAESLALINVSGAPLYLEGLYFESLSGALDIQSWNTEFLASPLTNFAAGGCLQVWSIDISAVLDAPANCARQGWIAVNDAGFFWTVPFSVYRFGELVATCDASPCRFNLDDRIEQAEAVSDDPPNSNPITVGATDLRLVYNDDSFALVNTSGADLNLTGLGFAGAMGQLSINDWNTADLSRPLSAFPPGDCLQVWSIFQEEWSPRPESCNIRHAWIAVNDAQTFWLDTFTVNYNGVVLATCGVAGGVCEVDLP